MGHEFINGCFGVITIYTGEKPTPKDENLTHRLFIEKERETMTKKSKKHKKITPTIEYVYHITPSWRYKIIEKGWWEGGDSPEPD